MARGKTSRRRTKSPPWRGTLRLGAVFAALLGLNAYFLFLRHGTSVPELQRQLGGKEVAAAAPAHGAAQAKSLVPPAAAIAKKSEPEVEVVDPGRSISGTVGDGETLAASLRREGVPAPTATEVQAALARVVEGRALVAGDAYTLHFDGEERLHSFEGHGDEATLYRVERTRSGSRDAWRAIKESAPLDVRVAGVGAVIEAGGSLYEALERAGETPALAAAVADIMAWDANLYVDPQPGDRVKILVEKQLLGDKFWKYGHVVALEYAGKSGALRAFYHQPEGGESVRAGAYYTEAGDAVAKSLLKTPLEFVRVPPSFDVKRLHPVVHTERAQLGVDYAAPAGTPVWAIAPGRVAWKGDRPGDGQTVVIEHPGGMESIHMHLSRIARGIEAGQPVRQKQVIGYVGQSGGAAAPHLHFSVKMGGHFVDPLRLRPAREPSLPAEERAGFPAEIAPRLEALARIVVAAPAKRVARAAAPPR